MGRVTEILPSTRDVQVRGAKVVVGKTKAIIERTISKLYPIEFANEQYSNSVSDTYDNQAEFVINSSERDGENKLASTGKAFNEKLGLKRKAAIIADQKLKLMK